MFWCRVVNLFRCYWCSFGVGFDVLGVIGCSRLCGCWCLVTIRGVGSGVSALVVRGKIGLGFWGVSGGRLVWMGVSR
jgi:hypothetical protein